jgi:hypothetical protein
MSIFYIYIRNLFIHYLMTKEEKIGSANNLCPLCDSTFYDLVMSTGDGIFYSFSRLLLLLGRQMGDP